MLWFFKHLFLNVMCLWQHLPLKCIRLKHLTSECTGFVAKYQLRSLIKILFWHVLFICPSRPQAGEGGLKQDNDTPKPVVPNSRRQDWPILGKGSNNQNGNLRWFLPRRGGGLEGVSSATYLFWKMIFLKNHLESFPDCENVFCT